MLESDTHSGQKKELVPLELELQKVVNHHVCWESNPGPLGEQSVSTEPSLQCRCFLKHAMP